MVHLLLFWVQQGALSLLALGKVLAQITLAGASFSCAYTVYTSDDCDPLTERAPFRLQPVSAEMKSDS